MELLMARDGGKGGEYRMRCALHVRELELSPNEYLPRLV